MLPHREKQNVIKFIVYPRTLITKKGLKALQGAGLKPLGKAWRLWWGCSAAFGHERSECQGVWGRSPSKSEACFAIGSVCNTRII